MAKVKCEPGFTQLPKLNILEARKLTVDGAEVGVINPDHFTAPIQATFDTVNSFSMTGNHTEEFQIGRQVQLDSGQSSVNCNVSPEDLTPDDIFTVNKYDYSIITAIQYDGVITDVTIADSILTGDLEKASVSINWVDSQAGLITTTDLINSTQGYPSDFVLETSGFTNSGDGGGGKWIQNGVIAQTPSQTPAQIGEALLNDANGNQWRIDKLDDISQLGGLPSTDILLPLTAALETFSSVDIGEGDFTCSGSVSTFIKTKISGRGASKTRVFLTSASNGTTNIFVSATDNPSGDDRYAEFSVTGLSLVRQTNTQGRAIEVVGDFAKNQSVILDDVIFRGDTAASASPFYFDRCAVIDSVRVAEIVNCRVHGNIDTTIDPAGQYNTIAFESIGSAGSHSYRSTDVFTTYTAIKAGDGVEGVYVRGCNLANVVNGIDFSTSIDEPGGWIDGVHVNAINTCVLATNRSSMVITDLVLFRSNAYFESPEWIGLDLDAVTSSNINGLQFKPQPITTGLMTNVRISDMETTNFSDLYLHNGTGIKSLGGNDTINFSNVVFHALDASIDLDSSDNRVFLGVHQFVAMTAEYGTIPDKANISIQSRGVRYNGVDTSDTVLIASSGTQTVRPSADNNVLRYSLESSTFTQNIDVRGFESFRGDTMRFIIQMPDTDTPTIRLRDDESNDTLMSLTGSGTATRYAFDLTYSGSRWEYSMGNELLGFNS